MGQTLPRSVPARSHASLSRPWPLRYTRTHTHTHRSGRGDPLEHAAPWKMRPAAPQAHRPPISPRGSLRQRANSPRRRGTAPRRPYHTRGARRAPRPRPRRACRSASSVAEWSAPDADTHRRVPLGSAGGPRAPRRCGARNRAASPRAARRAASGGHCSAAHHIEAVGRLHVPHHRGHLRSRQGLPAGDEAMGRSGGSAGNAADPSAPRRVASGAPACGARRACASVKLAELLRRPDLGQPLGVSSRG